MNSNELGKLIGENFEYGYGFDDKIYKNIIKVILDDKHLSYKEDISIPIKFRENQIGTKLIDLIVENSFLIYLYKDSIEESINKCKIYMKQINISSGLVIVFPKYKYSKLIIISLEILG
jgi:GxxExxY protein